MVLAAAVCLAGVLHSAPHPRDQLPSSAESDSASSDSASSSSSLAEDLVGPASRAAKRKRQWESDMRVWGKRSATEAADTLDHPNTLDTLDTLGERDNKRSWNKENGLRVWGKRQWAQNEAMRVWGKRSPSPPSSDHHQHDDEDEEEHRGHRGQGHVQQKRQWNDNGKALRVWGKRAGWNTNSARIWGKRGWDTRSIPVWGKR